MSKSRYVEPLVDLHGRGAWSVLPALLAGFSMIMIDTTIVNIAAPTLVTDFNASLVEVGWVNSAYLLTFAVLLLVSGRLGDIFGPKPVYIVGLVLFTLSSLAAGLSGYIGSEPAIGWLIAFRAVQGVGGAIMTPQTQSMITRVFPAAQRGAALGMWGAVAGISTIAGPLLGGVLVEYATWEWIFYVNVPIGVLAVWLSVVRLPTVERHARAIDVPGVLLSIAGMSLLIFGLQEGNTYSWGEIRWGVTVWEVIGLGAALLVGFVLWQLRLGDEALLPVRLFVRRNFFLANVSVAAVSFAMVGIFFPFTVFLQQVEGLSAIQAALVSLPGSLMAGVVAPVAGRTSDKIAAKWLVAGGFGVFAVAISWLAAWIDVDASPWRLLAPMALFGVGTGLVMSPLANLATVGLDGRNAGAGAGAFNTNRQVGSVLGSAAIIALLTARLSSTVADAAQQAASTLPSAYQSQFLAGLSHVGGGSGGFSTADVPLPASVPAQVASTIEAAATTAVHQGFAAAVSQTLLLAAAVALLGMVSALAMRGGRTHQAPTSPDEPEPVQTVAA